MNVFDLVAKLKLDKTDYEDGLKAAKVGIKSFGSTFASGFKTAAKVGAAAMTAAAGAVTLITKEAVTAYASYEQLTGGITKLFGEDAQSLMMAYAENAWKTSGMSANQYMEQATGFAASMISSLGGDTKKAADMTNVAMQAMSDNVNTYGSDMDSVQAAFQGFAKQNYTLLDNLKLGKLYHCSV